MGIHTKRATDSDLNRLLEHARDDSLTYGPTGLSLDESLPTTLTRREWSARLTGTDAFDRAVVALETWSVHRGAGLDLAADGPLAPGTNVAFRAPLPIGFVDGTCRIVATVDEPDRRGFAYGTLDVHPERGEESFVVSRDSSAGVGFHVVGVSRPSQPLGRVFAPIAHRLQEAAVRRYLTSMQREVSRDR